MKSLYNGLLSGLLMLSAFLSHTQTPGNPIPLTAGTRADAYFPCDFSAFSFTNEYSYDQLEVPPDYCPGSPIVPHNIQWIGFTPQTSSLIIELEAVVCEWHFGIQVGVWKAPDEHWPYLQYVLPCYYEVPPYAPTNLYLDGLQPGALYYFVFDGYDGDICEIEMHLQSGFMDSGTILGETSILMGGNEDFQVCTGSDFSLEATSVFNASIYNWTIDGEPQSNLRSFELSIEEAGSYEVCVTPTNGCDSLGTTVCETIEVFDLPELSTVQDTVVCGAYTLPPIEGSNLTGNENYYLSNDFNFWESTPVPVGTTIDTSVSLTIMDGIENYCASTRSFDILITQPLAPDTLADQTGCNFFVFTAPDTSLQLPPVTYYSAPNGNGNIFLPGDTTFNSGTYYRIFEQDACLAEQAFEVELSAAYCPDGVVSIAGQTTKPDGTPISNTQISLQSFSQLLQSTDTTGHFAFDSIPGGFNYTLLPTRQQDVLDGVDLSDAFAILKHVYGLETFYDTPQAPYLLIAADVNSDQAVTVADFAIVRNTFMGLLDTFPSAPSWRFIPAGFTFDSPNNPWLDDFPESAAFPNLLTDTLADFYGIKIGDVDFTNTAEGLQAAPPARLCMPNPVLKRGEKITVPVTVKTDRLAGVQFELRYDTSRLRLLKAQPNKDLFPDQPVEELRPGQLPVMLLCPATEGIAAGTTLLTLEFAANQPGQLYSGLEWPISERQALSVQADGQKSPLLFTDCNQATVSTSDNIEVPNLEIACLPNPFSTSATLSFHTPVEGPVEIQVFTPSGQRVKRLQQQYGAGTHHVTLGDWLPYSGSFLITVTNQNETARLWAVRM